VKTVGSADRPSLMDLKEDQIATRFVEITGRPMDGDP